MQVLELNQISKEFHVGGNQRVYAVNDVTLSVANGETLAVIGESGSGKSTLGRLALRLLEPTKGSVFFKGQDLATVSARSLRKMRGNMQIIFQEPYESLNPRITIFENILEPVKLHKPELDRSERRQLAIDTLQHVGLGPDIGSRYPGELSGGQQQRVGIARAIITRPSLIVLDEPTSSLDLSVRAQILQLLKNLQEELDLAYVFISHDIHTVRYISDHIAVMYQGRIVETGPTAQVFAAPWHPYTQALLASALSVDPDEQPPPLSLGGDLPTPTKKVSGCVLYPRCPIRTDECLSEILLTPVADTDRAVACINADISVHAQ